MTTKKQRRAEYRIQYAKDKKTRRFRDFVYKVAVRRLKKPGDAAHLTQHFCCLPDSLEMPRDEFLSKGQQLCGGAAVLFDRGELIALLPSWTCSARNNPTILSAAYVRECFLDDGSRRNLYADRPHTSGSSNG